MYACVSVCDMSCKNSKKEKCYESREREKRPSSAFPLKLKVLLSSKDQKKRSFVAEQILLSFFGNASISSS